MKQKPELTPRRFVFFYIIPLFLAALLLVLISYYGELRTRESRQAAASGGLHERTLSLPESDEAVSPDAA